MTAVRIATITSSGLEVEYEEGEVRVGSEPSSLQSVLDYDRIGALTWVNEETRSWAYEQGASTALEGTTGPNIVVSDSPAPAPPAAAPSAASEFVHGVAAKVSTTARAVSDGAMTDPRPHSMPLWAKVTWGVSMGANFVLLALVAFVVTEGVGSIDFNRLLDFSTFKLKLVLGAGMSMLTVYLWPLVPYMLIASLAVSVVALALPAYGLAHRVARANRNKYGRALIIGGLSPLFIILLLPVLFTFSGLSLALGVFLARL